ncbi:3-isopropylmalate dehydrogenase [Alicyclobacillus sp.]|uniref:3-isopropylmalate dehydrogenase n=1 Tax=Alicyclobacillus sp. TaxID=61169 RepID=UPI0025BEC376|nr:3-isopropylmalate dehydrogenase [Alicyclobacillus sp.]MCL6516089.1 3-isopropylmalate dehydrogenase [Alicyclobacillus sp.]
MEKRIVVLPGDGIGPEVTGEAVRLLGAVGERFGHRFEFQFAKIGGAAIDETGVPLPDETLRACLASDAVLLGAVGGPRWDRLPGPQRPEAGLLKLRKALGVYANLRPITVHAPLAGASTLKPEVVEGVDFVIVRELTGGLYFGAKERRQGEHGVEVTDTLVYTEQEVERILRLGFELARQRRRHLTSVDKANVLESSRLWREIAERLAPEYPDVTLTHLLVDNAAMQLVKNPRQFDVIVTENMFGDILSDEAAMITGSIGLLPSASLGSGGPGLYEPIHGSAPDIAGQGLANPLATFASVAMMLDYGFGLAEEAAAVRRAIAEVLSEGWRTADIAAGGPAISTEQMGEKVRNALR